MGFNFKLSKLSLSKIRNSLFLSVKSLRSFNCKEARNIFGATFLRLQLTKCKNPHPLSILPQRFLNWSPLHPLKRWRYFWTAPRLGKMQRDIPSLYRTDNNNKKSIIIIMIYSDTFWQALIKNNSSPIKIRISDWTLMQVQSNFTRTFFPCQHL